MSIYVFTGPSLSPEEGREILDATFLPPVSQGDVYRVALKRPRAIGIIDGYFERVPAVWHNEILWAMSRGCHVFGCSSMGALRAVELEAFGMEGLGKIYEAFRRGDLEDDDEVAVSHGPAEMGYRVTSEAMVNMRFTFDKALEQAIISPATHTVLVETAKALFYPDRSYPEVLQRGETVALSPSELSALREWLPRGRVNQKREDAIAMLCVLKERLASGISPKRVTYTMESTRIWNVASSIPGGLSKEEGGLPVLPTALIEEMQVEGSYSRIADGALMRFLASNEASRQNMTVTGEQLQQTGDRWRDKHGLADLGHFRSWLSDHDLSTEDFSRMVREQGQRDLVKHWASIEVLRRLLDELYMTGEYDRLVSRVRDKQNVLESLGLQNPDLEQAGTNWETILRWYFEERLGRPIPNDLLTYAYNNGFEDEFSVRRALLREYCYLTHDPKALELSTPLK